MIYQKIHLKFHDYNIFDLGVLYLEENGKSCSFINFLISPSLRKCNYCAFTKSIGYWYLKAFGNHLFTKIR